MLQSRRLSIPALVVTFIGGALAAMAINDASASSGRANPAEPYRAAVGSAVTPASAGCAVHLTGGTAPAQNYDVCVSGHGNVNGFSWGDASVYGPFQYLDNEGYCIAREPSTSQKVNYYDAGSVGEAGFGPATTSMASALTFTVKRTTLDGVLEVTQNFFLKPGTSQLFIGMVVKNLDSVNHHLLVERYFHPNITAPWFGGLVGGSTLHWTGAEGFQSISADTSNSSSIYLGVQLHATSRNVYMGGGSNGSSGGRIGTPSFPSVAGDCGATSVTSASPSPGDNYGGVRELTYAGATPPVVPGGTLKFQFVYRIY